MDHIALLKHVIGNLRAGLSEGQGLVRSGFGFCDPCEVNLDRPDIYELATVNNVFNGIEVPLPLDKEPEHKSNLTFSEVLSLVQANIRSGMKWHYSLEYADGSEIGKTNNTLLTDDGVYRAKLTKTVNGITVPYHLTCCGVNGEDYYFEDPSNIRGVSRTKWGEDSRKDEIRLMNGVCYSTFEEAKKVSVARYGFS